MKRLLRNLAVLPIRLYQRFLSPLKPPTCRFHPTCSSYAVEALQVHGAARGSWLTMRRLLKCAPWHPGGIDLVPARRPHRACRRQRHFSEEQAPC